MVVIEPKMINNTPLKNGISSWYRPKHTNLGTLMIVRPALPP